MLKEQRQALFDPFAPSLLKTLLYRLSARAFLRAFAHGFPIPSKDFFRKPLTATPQRLHDFGHEFPPLSPLEDLGGIFPYRQNLYIAFLCGLSAAKF
jgi:hypothetical protein